MGPNRETKIGSKTKKQIVPMIINAVSKYFDAKEKDDEQGISKARNSLFQVHKILTDKGHAEKADEIAAGITEIFADIEEKDNLRRAHEEKQTSGTEKMNMA